MNVIQLLQSINNVSPDMLNADFWLARVDNPDAILFSVDEIRAYNARVYERIGIPPVFDLPQQLSKADAMDYLTRYALPEKTRYQGDGRPYDNDTLAALQHNALPDLPAQINLSYGLVIQSTHLRTFPTHSIASGQPLNIHQDWFQETRCDIGTPFASLTASRDGKFVFALTPHYWGWLDVQHIAYTDRVSAQAYAETDQFLLTTASQSLIGFATEGGITPQMGTRFPLRNETENAYVVSVPTRNSDGNVAFSEGFAPKMHAHISAFRVGFLPLSLKTLFNQGFALLGERYAWGGSRVGIFGRDCSRFAKDVYATTGVIMPRNGDEQETANTPRVTFDDSMNTATRYDLVRQHAQAGDILFTPGHVMLYLGVLDERPYILHAAGTPVSAVAVSTLDLGYDGENGALIDRLISVTKII